MNDDIKRIPTDDLMAELKRREDARKPPKPKPIPMSEVNWSKVYELALQYQASVEGHITDDERSEFGSYFKETAIEAVFGNSFWPWSHAQDER